MAKSKIQKIEDALDNLKAALKILRNEEKWTQDTLAEIPVYGDEDGEIVEWICLDDAITDDKNAKFCALGAVQHVDGPGERLATDLLIEAAGLIKIGEGFDPDELADAEEDIFYVNDDLGYDETLSMFETAIKLAKTQIKTKIAEKKKKSKR